jgi:hypothetical protein
MNNETISVRISKSTHQKIKKHTEKRKQSITGFLDLAVSEKIKADKLSEKILKSSTSK